MRSISNLSVIVIVAMSGLQTNLPAALPATLRDHVKDERFEVVSSIRGLPLGVRNELQALFGSSTLDIANPDAEFQATDVITNPTLPMRRLVAAGCSSDHCLVYYERGGKTHSWLVALFQWTPGVTRVEWGGNAGGGLANIGDVRNAVVTGVIKGPVKIW